jgi:hypothetical protein
MELVSTIIKNTKHVRYTECSAYFSAVTSDYLPVYIEVERRYGSDIENLRKAKNLSEV